MSALLTPVEHDTTITTCATLGCREKGGHGLTALFCASCADSLARIRAELEAEATEFHRQGAAIRRRECATPGCGERVRWGVLFCAVCVAMDVAYEDAA